MDLQKKNGPAMDQACGEGQGCSRVDQGPFIFATRE